jgi:alpha-tubulin suppressor-like RCC1 family protein
MGTNGCGQLGDGTYNSTNKPEEIVDGGVTAIAVGRNHSLFLKSDGSLWAMGSNNQGQLGDGNSDSEDYQTNQPEEIVASNVVAIAAGEIHSLFLKSDGSLWGMGSNGSGALGGDTYSPSIIPKEIISSNVVAIAVGASHSLFLKSDGSLWTMGADFFGELGDGTNNDAIQPEKIIASSVIAIAGGYYHSLFIKADGSLWAMGGNVAGQLGDGFNDINPPYGTASPEQILPSPRPFLTETVSADTNLLFTAACLFGGNYLLLKATNLTQPLNQWTSVWTNVITFRPANTFFASLTNTVNSVSPNFFILQSQ